MIENVAVEVRDVQIRAAVVIVIANRYAHSIRMSANTRFLRHVGKGEVPIVVVEPVPEFRIGLVHRLVRGLRVSQRRAVDEEYVEKAIAIVIEHRDAAGHGFDQVLLRSRAPVTAEIDMCAGGHITKDRQLWMGNRIGANGPPDTAQGK